MHLYIHKYKIIITCNNNGAVYGSILGVLAHLTDVNELYKCSKIL